jgi:homoserine kinase
VGVSGPSIAVRVPASSANLGPGFDVLGMALGLYAEVGTGAPPDGAVAADRHHPATIAFRALGGVGALWVRSRIPMSRGLGYSGAMRIGGAAVGAIQRSPGGTEPDVRSSAEVLAVAADLEGHGDNVAASQIGGVTVFADGAAVSVPLGFATEPVVVAWSPSGTTTSTNRSRAALPELVNRVDATFNVANVAALMVALQSGDVDLLALAMRDRLHQSTRLESLPESAEALQAGGAAGAWCGWLSGSGPTVAFLCAPDRADQVALALHPGGQVRTLRIDHIGIQTFTT